MSLWVVSRIVLVANQDHRVHRPLQIENCVAEMTIHHTLAQDA